MTLDASCYNCGRRNPPGARFCGRCGVTLEVPRCGNCQALLAVGARFCGQCGVRSGNEMENPSPAEGTKEEVRTATVLFGLLADVAPLVEEEDPEEVRDLLDEVFRLLRREVERFGGVIDKIMADSILALFGVPTAHEDDATRAVKAALAMTRALEVFNRRLFEQRGLRLSYKVGINTGKVFVGYVGAGGPRNKGDFTVMGDTVNTASRLEHAAPPGGILISETTRRALRERFDIRAWEPLTVKGKADPLKVHQVLGESPDPGRRVRPVPMVGRTRELDHLVGLWREVELARSVRWVTVYGDLGMGKGRLLEEFVNVVKRSTPPPLVFTVRDLPSHPDEPSDVLRMLVREIAGVTPWDDAAAEWSKIQDLARRSVRREGSAQEAAEIFARLARLPLPGRETLEASGRRRYFLPFRRLLEDLAQSQPVLIAVSALHDADNLALDFLEEVATQLPDLPVMILGLARQTLATRRPDWGAGAPRHHRLTMTPLGNREARQLLSFILGGEARVPMEWVEEINHFAGGNPLYLMETARAVLETHSGGELGELGQFPVPDSIESVIQSRIDRLTFEDGLTLRAAAVVGAVFWRGAVNALLGSDRVDSLGRLVERGFVVRQPQSGLTGEEEYTFATRSAAQVAYENLLGEVRRRYHGMAAEWLTTRLRRDPGPFRVNLAHHLERGGQPDRAAEVYREAAESALRAFEYSESLTLLDRALGCLGKNPEPLLAEEARLRLLRGLVRRGRGEYDIARQDLLQVVEMRHMLGDGQGVAEALLHLVSIDMAQGEFDRARNWLDEAEASMSPQPRPPLEAELSGLRAELALFHGELTQVEPLLNRAEIIWRRLGDKRGLASVMATRGRFYLRRSDFTQGRRAFREAVELREFLGDTPGLAQELTNLGVGCEALGDLGEARQSYARAMTIRRRLGDQWGISTLLLNQASTYLRSGYYARARTALEQARELSHNLPNPRGTTLSGGALGVVQLRVGLWEEATLSLKACVAQFELMGDVVKESEFRSYLGQSHLARGQVEEADAQFDVALGLGTRAGNPEMEAVALIGLAEVATSRGDLSRATGLVEELEWNEAVGRSPLLQSRSALVSGALALEEGATNRALSRFAEAERYSREHDFWPQVWEARSEMVRARRVAATGLPTAQWQEAIRYAQEALRELFSRIEGPDLIAHLRLTPPVKNLLDAVRAIRSGGTIG